MRHRVYIVLLALLLLALAGGRAMTPPAATDSPLLAIVNPAGTPEPVLSILPDTVLDASALSAGRRDTTAAQTPRTAALNSPLDLRHVADATFALDDYAGALRPQFAGDLQRFGDATRYELDLTVDVINRKVQGEQRTRYTNRGPQALTALMLRLYPNSQHMGGAMRVTRTLVAGQPSGLQRASLGGIVEPSAALLPLTAPLAPGQSIEIALTYEIDVPDDPKTNYRIFGWIDGVLSLPNPYVMIAPQDGSGGWLASPPASFGDIVVSEMALYRVRIVAPASAAVVATGVCGSEPLDRERKRVSCIAAPVRDFAIHLSSAYRVTEAAIPSGAESITLRSYYRAEDEVLGERALAFAADAVRAFEQRFGPYPYRELSVFASTTPIGGIEYPMTSGITPVRNDDAYFEWLVAHEVGHQWFYGLIGSDPGQEAWLDEALTQYATSLYVEARSGATEARDRRQRFFYNRWRREAGARNIPAGQVTLAFDRWQYAPIVYAKAPLFFQAVRDAVGDTLFDRWLREYADANRYGIATARDLLAAAERVGIGSPVQAAFAQWIATPAP
jgi:Peptidase family M1 domain